MPQSSTSRITTSTTTQIGRLGHWRLELVGERPANWVKEIPSTTCEHCGMEVKGTQWAFAKHQKSRRCLRAQK